MPLVSLDSFATKSMSSSWESGRKKNRNSEQQVLEINLNQAHTIIVSYFWQLTYCWYASQLDEDKMMGWINTIKQNKYEPKNTE